MSSATAEGSSRCIGRVTLFRGAVERKNQEVRKRLREVLGETHPRAFEQLMGEPLLAIGFEGVVVTRYVGDKGIDLRAGLVVGGITNVRTAIQVKRYTSGSIGAPVVRELRGGLGPHERGLVITLSSFSKDAQREAAEPDRSPISLVNGEELIDLLIANQVGVSSSNVTILELDEGSFTEGADDEVPEALSSDPVEAPRRARRPSSGDGRVLSLWPLPGGASAWKATLDSMLRYRCRRTNDGGGDRMAHSHLRPRGQCKDRARLLAGTSKLWADGN